MVRRQDWHARPVLSAARGGRPRNLGQKTARKLAVLAYRMLRDGMAYQEPSASHYDQQQRTRVLRGLRRRAASLGLELVDPNTGAIA